MAKTLAISFILLLVSLSQAMADVMVIVRREAEASGNYVRICDVARLEGPRDQVAEVAETVIGPTPPRGSSTEITRWDIENRLFEMGVTARVTFTGNSTVKVFGNGERRRFGTPDEVELQALRPLTFRPSSGVGTGFATDEHTEMAKPAAAANALAQAREQPQEKPVDPAAIASAMPENARTRVGLTIANYLAGMYSAKRPDIEVEAKVLSLSEAIPFEVHAVEVAEALDGKVPGRANLRLRVKETAASEPRLILVAADTEVFGKAPVAAKQLFKGDVLGAGDVVVTRVKMQAGQSYLPPNPGAAAGRELKRNFTIGEPLLASETMPTEAVKRGDIVRTFNQGKGYMIEGNAKAQGGGMVGDVIKVEDTATKARYDARIIDRGKVTVLKQDWRTK